MKRLILIQFFVPVIMFAQVNSTRVQTKKLISEKYFHSVSSQKVLKSVRNFPSISDSTGLTTTYDYFANSIIRDQISIYNGTPYLSNRAQPINGNTDSLILSYFDGTNWLHYPVASPVGSPQIDISLTGDSTGMIGITGGSPSELYIYEGGGNFRSAEYGSQNGSSFQFAGNNIFLAGDNGSESAFYKSTDFGNTFSQWGKLSDFPIYSTAPVSEIDMFKSQDEQFIVYAATAAGDGEVYNGVQEDHADNVWVVYSSDQGSTWTGNSIGYDGEINSVAGYHTQNFAPLYENFGQIDGTVGNDGVIHIVANGYGVVFDSPSGGNMIGSSFPVLYWNSTTNQWKSISDNSIDTIQNIVDFYPGNDLGQSYPGIAESEDGQVLFVTWTGPQLTADGQIDTANANGYYWTDVYCAYSMNGGNTWVYGGALLNDPTISECYAHPAQHLRINSSGHYMADIVYLADLSPGVSVFGEGNETDNPIMYMTYEVGLVEATGNRERTVNNFALMQNYPNPFNPVTTIKYSIATRENVSLRVYDALGKEVAILVNSTQKAGEHQVNFDASNLASGVYIYTIKAGSYFQTRKMILLK